MPNPASVAISSSMSTEELLSTNSQENIPIAAVFEALKIPNVTEVQSNSTSGLEENKNIPILKVNYPAPSQNASWFTPSQSIPTPSLPTPLPTSVSLVNPVPNVSLVYPDNNNPLLSPENKTPIQITNSSNPINYTKPIYIIGIVIALIVLWKVFKK